MFKLLHNKVILKIQVQEYIKKINHKNQVKN